MHVKTFISDSLLICILKYNLRILLCCENLEPVSFPIAELVMVAKYLAIEATQYDTALHVGLELTYCIAGKGLCYVAKYMSIFYVFRCLCWTKPF